MGESNGTRMNPPAARVNRLCYAADAEPSHPEAEEFMGDNEFLTDIQLIRKRARQHLSRGPVTPGYRGDLPTILKLLNEALATEIVCVLRYKRHHYMASGLSAQPVAAEFLQHANEEQGHADLIAARIVQLGGEPNFSPEGLVDRSHSEYAPGKDLIDMIEEDLVAERVAIDSYGDMIRYVGDSDPTTRRMLEDILAVEEEHADDLANLLGEFGRGDRGKPKGKPKKGTAKKARGKKR
jgi:bacterioferritin